MKNLYNVPFLELIFFTQFLFFKKIEKHIILILLPLLLVSEWPYLPMISKRLTFYIKKMLFSKEIEGFLNFRLIFSKIIIFSRNTFSERLEIKGKSSMAFPKIKNSMLCAKFPMGSKFCFFSIENIFFPIHWCFLHKFSVLFSTVKIKLGHPNSSVDSKLGLWNLGLV